MMRAPRAHGASPAGASSSTPPVFVGREDILGAVVRALAERRGRGIILHGPPRIGKTSMLRHLLLVLPELTGNQPVYFDPHERGAQPLDEVLTDLALTIALALELPLPRPAADVAAWLSDVWLPSVLAQRVPLVLLIDELDTVANANEQQAARAFHPFLRKLADAHAPNLRLVIALGRGAYQWESAARAAFPGFAFGRVSLLSRDDVEALIRAGGPPAWSEEAIAAAWDLTRGHPLLLEVLGGEVRARVTAERTVTPGDVAAAKKALAGIQRELDLVDPAAKDTRPPPAMVVVPPPRGTNRPPPPEGGRASAFSASADQARAELAAEKKARAAAQERVEALERALDGERKARATAELRIGVLEAERDRLHVTLTARDVERERLEAALAAMTLERDQLAEELSAEAPTLGLAPAPRPPALDAAPSAPSAVPEQATSSGAHAGADKVPSSSKPADKAPSSGAHAGADKAPSSSKPADKAPSSGKPLVFVGTRPGAKPAPSGKPLVVVGTRPGAEPAPAKRPRKGSRWAAPAFALGGSAVIAIAYALQTKQIDPSESAVALFDRGESRRVEMARVTRLGLRRPAGALTWLSADPRVAKVGADGTITPAGSGKTRVTAQGGRFLSSVEVTVSLPARIALDPAEIELSPGVEKAIAARVLDEAGAPWEKRTAVAWSVSAPAVATVTDGKVRCTGTGEAVIEARAVDLTARARLRCGGGPSGQAADCDAGRADVCLQLGQKAEKGSGEPANLRAALAWYEKACAGGSTKGCVEVGGFHEDGKLGKADPAKAVAIYQKACDAGEPLGCSRLGTMYEGGGGVVPNIKKARELHTKACDAGDADGCWHLGAIYELGNGVARDTPTAAAHYQKACDGGRPAACSSLANMYWNGSGKVAKDVARGLALYEKACEAKHESACTVLALNYKAGDGVEVSRQKSLAYFYKACQAGSKSACVIAPRPPE